MRCLESLASNPANNKEMACGSSAAAGGPVVEERVQTGPSQPLKVAASSGAGRRAPPVPAPMPVQRSKDGLPNWAAYLGGGSLGAIQGAISGGLAGAFAGAGIGLAAAYLYTRKDYGAAYGTLVGSILGLFLSGGNPLGGLVGGAAVGLAGHFVGKLFP